MEEELHINPFLVDGSGPINESGKEQAAMLYVGIEGMTMALDTMSDEVALRLTKAQWELIMASLSIAGEL